MNKGLNLELEKQHCDGTEWKFGAFSVPCITEIPLDERYKYLPKGEMQNLGEEKSSCVTRGYLNILETKFNWLLLNDRLSTENHNWLIENKYTTPDGKIEFSDAYIAQKSGTTRQGNSMVAPADAIRKCGLIPKSLMPQLSTFDEDYDPKRITPEIEKLAIEFKERFTINYEQVYSQHFPILLNKDLLNVAAYAWPSPVNGIYPKPESFLPFNHDFVLFNLPMSYAYDNYLDDGKQDDFIKQLAPDYTFYEYGYRIYITSENTIDPSGNSFWENIKDTIKQIAIALGIIEKKIDALPKKPVQPPENAVSALIGALKASVGKDLSPKDLASDEFGCAESLSNIIHSVIPSFPGDILSTKVLCDELLKSPHFRGTLQPSAGCIIVSPRTQTTNGHCGGFITDVSILSTNSKNGMIEENYTIDSWVDEFVIKRKLQKYIFKII